MPITGAAKEDLHHKKRRKKHTRASRACTNCRIRKTRCLWTDGTAKCLRCLSLNVPCSLEVKRSQNHAMDEKSEAAQRDSQQTNEHDRKLDEISDNVKNLMRLIKDRLPVSGEANLPALEIAPNPSKFSESYNPINMTSNFREVTSTSAMNLVSILAMNQSTSNIIEFENSLPRTVLAGLGHIDLGFQSRCTNPVENGILSRKEGVELLRIFRDRYGRWISFPESYETENIYERVLSTCPLFFTIMCALSLKYGDPLLRERCYVPLLRVIKCDLEHTMLNPPLCLEYIQSLVILSLYGTNLSEHLSAGLCLDSWQLSSNALSVFLKMNRLGLYNRLYSVEDVEPEFNELTVHRIWNILILVHLAYCLLYGRKSNFSLAALQTRDVSQFSMSTKFDYRIVSECSIYSIMYKHTILNATREATVKEMEVWTHQWDFMFGKPLNQFIEIDFHWVWILIYLKEYGFTFEGQSLVFKTSNDATDPDCDKKFRTMEGHAYKILELIDTVKDDSYFAFLSDQIHLIVFFAAAISIDLLCLRRNNSKGAIEQTEENTTSNILIILLRYIYRLRKVSTTNEHPFFKFSMILEKSLTSKFSKQDLEATGMYSENDGISGTPYIFEDPGDEEEEAQELGQI